MKHFSDDDVEYAQQLAKLSLYNDKEDFKPKNASSLALKPRKDGLDIESKTAQKPYKASDIKNKMISSNNRLSKMHFKKGTMPQFKEGAMRIRQIIRFGKELKECLDYLEKLSGKKVKTSFKSPLELEKTKKHWEEFSHSARRALYSLKREINMLSLKISSPLNIVQDHSLRLLASVTRSCLHLMKGFESFPEEIAVGQKGNALLCEATVISQQILLLMAVGGVAVSFKPEKDRRKEICASNYEEESDILSSEMDSKAFSLLEPKAVRQKLSLLARSYMEKNSKQKKPTKYKLLAPLKTAKRIPKPGYEEEDQESESTPLTVELGNGRKIQFIKDSLSPKLRQRAQRDIKRGVPVTYVKRTIPEEIESPRDEPDNDYDFPEKMADQVFERILPFIKESAESLRGIPREETLATYSDMELYMEADRRLQGMRERLAKIEEIDAKLEEFLSPVDSRIAPDTQNNDSGSDSDFKDFNKVIQDAKDSLRKTAEFTIPSWTETIADIGQPDMKTNVSRTIQEELRNQKLEFWQSLVDNHYVIAPEAKNVKDQLEKRGTSRPELQKEVTDFSGVIQDHPLKENVFSDRTSINQKLGILREHKETQIDRISSYSDSFEAEQNSATGSDQSLNSLESGMQPEESHSGTNSRIEKFGNQLEVIDKTEYETQSGIVESGSHLVKSQAGNASRDGEFEDQSEVDSSKMESASELKNR